MQLVFQKLFTAKSRDKSKVMVFGTRKMLPKLQDITLSLLGKDLLPGKTAKDQDRVVQSPIKLAQG